VIVQFEATSEVAFRGARWARVLSQKLGAPGWLLLEADSNLLERRPSNGSFEVPGRYFVCHAAALRKELSLFSQEIAKVKPGEEVLLLRLGLSETAGEAEAAQVCGQMKAEGGEIGWLSLESGGVPQLDTTNLLGPGVADVYRQSLAAETRRTGAVLPSVRHSILGSDRRPWEVSMNYRTLEELPLMESPKTTESLGKGGPAPPVVPGGSLVHVLQIQSIKCDDLPTCPFARVSVEDGLQKGLQGWLRCSAKDGRDLVDTRDQLECNQILKRLRLGVPSEKGTPQTPKINAQAGPASLSRLRGEVDPEDAVVEGYSSLNDPDIACSHCVCSLLPPERNHPTLLAVHEPAPLVEAGSALEGLEPLPRADLERWVQNVYKRYNPRQISKVPDLLKDFEGQERSLVEKTCEKYRIDAPATWHGKGSSMVRIRQSQMGKA